MYDENIKNNKSVFGSLIVTSRLNFFHDLYIFGIFQLISGQQTMLVLVPNFNFSNQMRLHFRSIATALTQVTLNILNVDHKDFGTYECVAKNPLGESDGTINLSGKGEKTTNFYSISHFY